MDTKIIRDKMLEYYKGDPQRIQHFIKVEAFAAIIAERENVDKKTTQIISILGYIHDIGIKIAEKEYGDSNGKLQEKLGKESARALTLECGFSQEVADRVSFIVAHHHTYDNIIGVDYQILVEADIIVNIQEDNISKDILHSIKNNIFKTKSGIELLNQLYSK